MADELSEKIKALLSDPESLQKITAIASSLGMTGNGTAPPKEEPPPAPVSSLPASAPLANLQALPAFNMSGNRNTALLHAIKPFLRGERQSKLESLITAMSVAEIISGLKKGGGI